MDNKIIENMKKSYDKYADDRDKRDTQQWKLDIRQKFLELIQKENKTCLLEIGSGPGRDSRFFMNQGLEVTATDLSTEMVRLCKEKGIRAYELDFLNLHTLEETFDAVWALNCLLHVDKATLPKVLEEIKQIMNPQGLFFMGVYGGENSEGIYEDDFYTPHRFFSFFTDDAIKEVVSKHFDIVSFENIETGDKYGFQALILRKA